MKKEVIFLLLLTLRLSAQNTDSLLRILPKMPADTHRVRILVDLGKNLWIEGKDSVALQYLTQAVTLSQKINFGRGEAEARLQLVRMERDNMSNVEAAYAHLDVVDKLAKKLNDKYIEAFSLIRRAHMYEPNFQKQKAISSLLAKAQQIVTEIHNPELQSYIYEREALQLMNQARNAEAVDRMLQAKRLQEQYRDLRIRRSSVGNLGVFFLSVNKYDDALKAFNEASAIATKLHDPRAEAHIASYQGEILEQKHRYAEALVADKKAVEILEKIKGYGKLPRSYARLGSVYIELKEYDKALKYSQMAADLFNKTNGGETMQHLSQINFGKIYLIQKNYGKVVEKAKEGLSWALQNDPPLMAEAAEYNRQLSIAYDKLGQPQKAIVHFKQYKAESDSILNNEALQKITVSSMTYEFEKKQEGDKIHIKTLENEQLAQTRNILIGLSVLGVLGLIFVLWSNRKLKSKNEQLKNKNREIEEALFKGQNIERKRVASELHDNLNTKLAAVRWHLEAMQAEDFNAFNQKIHSRLIDMANDVYADVRLISHNMLPAELETHGLVSALQKLVEKLNVNTKTVFHLVANAAQKRPPSQVEHQLYNIALELVNNVLKHAQASEVWISLSQTATQLTLTVSDNGVGMPTEIQSDGIGMRNLQSRVDVLAGHLTLDSTPEIGTKVSVEIPIPA
ncbi:tetratricopeptide repeat-containing sensor histidine kinase [Runella sp.]|uniref:tetratricopeptide repeat-containing sensor histidine kinase n=1 Tax=Runella sp. TaxID=1960881 RepID=UPI003D0CCCD9